MKKALSIFFAVLMLFQHGSRLWVIASFEANRKMIAELLCINQDKPELGCNGHCYLKKQLEQTGHDDDTSLPLKRKAIEEVLYLSSVVITPLGQLTFQPNTQFHIFYHPPVSEKACKKLIKPPIA